jgi:pimeloyl-ACP methyl ester carboxylesterase
MKRIVIISSIIVSLILLITSKTSEAQTYFKVDVMGKGKPMILIHGLYCSADVWKETVDHYKDKYECHVLTLAGFGGNPPLLKDYFLEAVKNDLVDYVKLKKLKKPVIMGHSMGGFISLWAAASSPDLFEKVISVDGPAFLAALQMPGATAESSKGMATQIKNGMSNQTSDQVLANQKAYLPTMISTQERIDQVAAIAVKGDAKTQGEVMYELFTTDLREPIASINSPVLMLGAWIAYKDYGATHDSVLKAYESQLAKVKNAKVEITDTAKHFIFYDDAAWFFEKVDSFLK